MCLRVYTYPSVAEAFSLPSYHSNEGCVVHYTPELNHFMPFKWLSRYYLKRICAPSVIQLAAFVMSPACVFAVLIPFSCTKHLAILASVNIIRPFALITNWQTKQVTTVKSECNYTVQSVRLYQFPKLCSTEHWGSARHLNYMDLSRMNYV